jgi:hypothetical protein
MTTADTAAWTYKSTAELLGDELPSLTPTRPVILGVLGHSTKWTRDTIAEGVMNPLISELGQLPHSLRIPSEGETSMLIQIWGERQGIECQVLDADWKRLGRKARALRDSKILKESSHLFFFLGNRSDYYEKVAIREAKKGKVVFTMDPESNEIVQWVVE